MPKYEWIKWCDHQFRNMGVISLSALSFNHHFSRRITLINGLHGDELSSILFLKHFIENHVADTDFRIDIIPFVNWLGHFEGTRNYGIGDINFNLVDASDSEEINAVIDDLISFASGSELVIDFHNWDALSILFGITFEQSYNPKDLALRFLCSFGCQFIWSIDQEQRFEKTLGHKFRGIGQPYCAIELPRPDDLVYDQFKGYAERLQWAIRNMNNSHEISVPIFGSKSPFVARVSGVYAPEKYPGEHVKLGDTVGTVFDSTNFEVKETIKASHSGIILHSSTGEFVCKNQVLGFIGFQS